MANGAVVPVEESIEPSFPDPARFAYVFDARGWFP
jgi:hypothetical protein